ncbi:MAG: DUF4190 domain-containing protein [Byssovorax sp.]
MKKPVGDATSTLRSGRATASLALGVAGLVTLILFLVDLKLEHRPLWILAGLSAAIGLAAVVVGILALREIKRRPELRGRGLAIAGIVMGALSLLTLF